MLFNGLSNLGVSCFVVSYESARRIQDAFPVCAFGFSSVQYSKTVTVDWRFSPEPILVLSCFIGFHDFARAISGLEAGVMGNL
jgi:hypothetical protein